MDMKRDFKFYTKILSVFTLVIMLFAVIIIQSNATNILEDYTSLYGKTKEYYNITITTSENENLEKLLPNSKYVIKRIVTEDEVVKETEPIDVKGETIGKEEVINGEICRTFTSDENGEIKLNLMEGKYKITQISTEEGYLLNEENTYIVNVEKVRGALKEVEVETPLTESYSVESVSTEYVVEGRNDGYALYYYKDWYTGGKLSLVSDENEIVDTVDSDEVFKIVAVENGWYVLAEDYITKESYVIYYDDTNGILEKDEEFKILLPNGFRSFDIDDNGNFILAGDIYTYEDAEIEDVNITNSCDVQIVVVDSTGENILDRKIFGGEADDFANTIIVTEEAYYLSVYFNSDNIKINDKVIDVDSPYCVFKVDKGDLSIEKVQILPTYTEAANQDEFRRIHTIRKGPDENLYYIGSFEDQITFDASLTQSGEEITLYSKGEEDGIVMKLDKNLLIEWVVDIGGEGNDHFYDADITEDGGIVIGGDSDYGHIYFSPFDTQAKEEIYTNSIYGNAGKWRGITLKINKFGEAVWAYEFGYTANEGMYGVAVLSNDTFILCGFESPNGSTTGLPAVLRLEEYEVEAANEEPTKLEVTNSRKSLKIVTSASGNGEISGQYDNVYEFVKFSDDATKNITITPEIGYKIKYIKINGQTIEFTPEEDNSYIIDKLENIKEDINIEVEFEIDPNQTKELKYTVEYYKDGVKQDDDTEVFTKEIQILDEETKTLKVDKSKINLLDKYEDYYYEKSSPEIIPEEVEDSSIIKVYYKSKKTKILINHIDINTKATIETEEIDVIIGENYVGKAKDIENYALVERPENEIIEITEGENVLNYYYAHKSEGVIEKHIDILTGELLDNRVYEGNEGDIYKTKTLQLEGYDLVESKLPENAEGKMNIEVIEVRYYYAKKAFVKVQYLNKENNGKIIEDIIIRGHEGDEYITDLKDFVDYEYIECSENTSGKMTVKVDDSGKFENVIIVKYYYKKLPKQNIYNITNNNITNNITNGELQPITYVITEGTSTTSAKTETVGKTDTSTSNNSVATGDMEFVIAVATIALVVVANIVQIVISKIRKK